MLFKINRFFKNIALDILLNIIYLKLKIISIYRCYLKMIYTIPLVH